MIPLSRKIKLMAGVLYIRQRINKESPILEPDEFKAMLENTEPSLRGFFDSLYAGTNPASKGHMTNEKNKKRLVLFCYFLAGLNNKFINGVKAEIGYMLDSTGASASAIETFAGAGLSIRHETVTKHKKKNELIHSETVGEFVSEHVSVNIYYEHDGSLILLAKFCDDLPSRYHTKINFYWLEDHC